MCVCLRGCPLCLFLFRGKRNEKQLLLPFFRSAGRKVHFVVGRAKKVEYKIGKKENRTVQYLQGEKSYLTGSAQLRLLYVARSTLPPRLYLSWYVYFHTRRWLKIF